MSFRTYVQKLALDNSPHGELCRLMLNSDNAPRWRTEVGFMREIAWHYAKTWKTTGREIVIHYTIDRVRARLTACDIECDIEMSFEVEEEVQVSLSEMWN